jgi:acetyltransferase-like isoleucine patch superfamily enzyme
VTISGRLVRWAWRTARARGQITAKTREGHRFAAFGEESLLAFPPGTIFGEASIAIGKKVLVGELVTLSAGMVPGQDLGPEPVLRIGDRCVIGRGSHVVAHEQIDIGADTFTGPYVYITDQNHGYADLDTPIGRQLPRNDPVSIGAGCWLGAGTIVLPGAQIGEHVVVAAGAVVTRGKIPAYSVVAGVPARVIRTITPLYDLA